jgi:hypothetical protein
MPEAFFCALMLSFVERHIHCNSFAEGGEKLLGIRYRKAVSQPEVSTADPK